MHFVIYALTLTVTSIFFIYAILACVAILVDTFGQCEQPLPEECS